MARQIASVKIADLPNGNELHRRQRTTTINTAKFCIDVEYEEFIKLENGTEVDKKLKRYTVKDYPELSHTEGEGEESEVVIDRPASIRATQWDVALYQPTIEPAINDTLINAIPQNAPDEYLLGT